MSLTCRRCRALLPGYIERELTPRQRAWVSHHLNECPRCYVTYRNQQQLARELTAAVPRIGTRGDAVPQFDALRAAVLAQVTPAMSSSAKGTAMRHTMRRMQIDYARYSLAAFLLMVVLLLPLSIRNQTFSVPTQPTPEKTLAQGTAVAVLPADSQILTATLQAMLEATLQPNYAPSIGATDTP